MSEEYNAKQLEIMQNALQLFAHKGYDNTSVRDIAGVAGVNIAMISYYFGSKEKLLEAIFQRYIKNMRSILEQIVKSKDLDPIQKMNQIIDTYIDAITQNRDFHLLMVREQVILKGGTLYNVVKGLKQKNATLISSAIKAGEKAGFFRKGSDINMMAWTLFGTVNYIFSNRRYVCDQYNIKEDDEKAFDKTVINKLRNHLKSMFKYYLTNEHADKK